MPDTLHYYGNLLFSQQNDDGAELMYKRAVEVVEVCCQQLLMHISS
jgi:hypothetical protein